MKTTEILIEEAKKEGLVLAEEAAQKIVSIVEKTLVRIPLEADEANLKAIAPIGLIVIQALKPSLDKLIDFNHDGKIGE